MRLTASVFNLLILAVMWVHNSAIDYISFIIDVHNVVRTLIV